MKPIDLKIISNYNDHIRNWSYKEAEEYTRICKHCELPWGAHQTVKDLCPINYKKENITRYNLKKILNSL